MTDYTVMSGERDAATETQAFHISPSLPSERRNDGRAADRSKLWTSTFTFDGGFTGTPNYDVMPRTLGTVFELAVNALAVNFRHGDFERGDRFYLRVDGKIFMIGDVVDEHTIELRNARNGQTARYCRP